MESENSMGGTPPSVQDTARDTRAALWALIPPELRERAQWVLAAPDKSPRTPTGSHASSTDPKTWSDFETVARAARERGWGVGFVLTNDDPFYVDWGTVIRMGPPR